MDSVKRLVILGVGVAVVGVMSGVRPADAQTREARGTVTSVSDATISIKTAAAQEMTFVVDSATHLEVRSAAKKVQQAQPGGPSPRVKDFFEAGQSVLIRYREASGRNQALDISRVGSAGSGAGSSETTKNADGTVKSVTPTQLTIASSGREFTFGINKDTGVVVRGATKATKEAGGSTPITTFVHAGDTVTVTYSDAAGSAIASEVRVRIANK